MQVTAGGRGHVRTDVQPATVFVSVPQAVKVTAGGRVLARLLVPLAAVLIGVPQAVQVTAGRREMARPLAPRGTVLPQVPQAVHVTAPGRLRARPHAERMPSLLEGRQTVHVSVDRRDPDDIPLRQRRPARAVVVTRRLADQGAAAVSHVNLYPARQRRVVPLPFRFGARHVRPLGQREHVSASAV